jgi:uncharacterized membrane protein
MEQVKQGKRTAAFLGGVGLGAGLMYALDPDSGPRRRALLRDRTIHGMHVEEQTMEKGIRDLSHRLEGVLARLRHAFVPDLATDAVITERVRARLGRLVTHPSSIAVETVDGRVRLSGPVIERERARLVRAVALVRGVRLVDDALEAHAESEHVPGLQGPGKPRPRHTVLGLGREGWTPALRVVATGAGLFFGIRGILQRGLAGGVSTAIGVGLLARAITNRPPRQLLRMGAGRHGLEFQRTIIVDAPVAEVFRLLDRFENFPRFMAHVKEVRVAPEEPTRARWRVLGPGAEVEWDTVLTAREEGRLLAYQTLPGAKIVHHGVIRCEPVDEGRATRLDLRLGYAPAAGAPGHLLAQLFRKEPRHALEEDLLRLRSLLEETRGEARREGGAREEVR